MPKILRWVFCLFVFFQINIQCEELFCQSSKKSSIGSDLSSDFSIFINDGLKYYSSPVRFKGKEWAFIFAGAAATGGIMTLDDDVKRSVTGYNNFTTSTDWTMFKNLGELKYIAPASVILYTAGLFTRENELRITGRMILQSLAYSGLLVGTVKFITGRSRPYMTNNQFDFKWFEVNNDFLSFPSGHSAIAFSITSVLAERIDTWWARAILYPMAAGTAYSRIYDNEHWLSDVIIGSLAGFSAGYFVVHNNETKSVKKKSGFLNSIDFNISVNSFSFSYRF